MVTTSTHRVRSLDALRGLAILMMVLSGVVPYRLLPGWMYHAQLPPPTHRFAPDLAGITWVDMVFPMFLFAMGAAIPLALSRYLEKNTPWWDVQMKILSRGFLLAFFAIFLQHVRPFTLNAGPDPITWITALGGLLVMFLIYTRIKEPTTAKDPTPQLGATVPTDSVDQAAVPETSNPNEAISKTQIETQAFPVKQRLSERLHGILYRYRVHIQVVGWLSALTMLYFLTYPDGSGFRLTRSDIIIIVLTNMAVIGSWVWLATRNAPTMRYGIMALLTACILASTAVGWVKVVWNTSPAPWLFKFYYLKYLFIIIPGIITGEQLIRWGKLIKSETTVPSGKETIRYVFIVLTSILMILVTLAGLYFRVVSIALVLNLVFGLTLIALFRNLAGERAKLMREILYYGLFWLLLGFCFEPFEGGIKKDLSTFSYYFVTTGLTILILVVFMILLDMYKKQRWLPLLVENGQNPMIAYVGMMNFIYPVLGLTMLDIATNKFFVDPWMGFLRGLMYTIILAWLVAKLTRKGIVWKT
jgi:predicted acyltransferase